MRTFSKVVLALLLACSSLSFYAQNCELSGSIIDASNDQGLPLANIFYGEGKGITANVEGDYSLSLPYGTYNLEFSFVGYLSKNITVKLDAPTKNLDVNLLSVELKEALVEADMATGRETPVAFSNIDIKTINEELASQDIPMILNSTPGVYATQQGGGDGDARITIRGFSQRNIAVMLDGVPVNDMENGWVYWSNWFGLDAIMQTTQVQRGLGVSKLAVPSVGGTINIITKGIDQKRNTRIKQEVASNGFLRSTIGHTSGRLKGDWGYTVAASYKQGNGWVDGAWTEGFFYYGKVQKAIGNHVITLSGFGAPQSHGQRSYQEGIHIYDHEYANDLGVNTTGFNEYGLNYNLHAGQLTRYELDGEGNKINEKTEDLNERKNYYHKPQFSLKHAWAINDKLSLSNVAYLSIGSGGGTRLDHSTDILEDGSPDFQSIYDRNTGYSFIHNPPPFVTSDPNILTYISETEHAASNYLKSSINNHFWYGLLSSVKYKMNDKWTMSGGIDLRSYKGEHYREIYDLLGAEYLEYQDNPNSSTSVYREGDIIDYHNDAHVEWAGTFGQAEFKNEVWSGFISGSYAMTRYKRIDYFKPQQATINGELIAPEYSWESYSAVPSDESFVEAADGTIYTPESPELKTLESDWYYKGGFTVKTGFNRKLDEKNNVFVNLGYLDRAPRFGNVFDFDNELFLDIQNEHVKALELGYGYKSRSFSANLNSYLTVWENRPVNRAVTIPDPQDPENEISANINDMDATHMGVELEMSYELNSKLALEGVISLGDWTWNSKDTVYFSQDGQAVVDPITGEQESRAFDARGVHVGDAAQTQFGGLIRYEFKRGAYVKLRYTYFDRYFADFDPTELNGESAGRDPWQVPSYGLVDFHAGYQFKLSDKYRLNLRGSVLNLMNNIYVSDASDSFDLANFNDYSSPVTDAAGFDAGSAGVFFGQGTRFNVSATLNF